MRTYASYLCAFVCTLAPAVQADDLFPPDFRGLPGSIKVVWDFETSDNPAPYSELEVVPLPGSPLFPITPTADPLNMVWYSDANVDGWISLPQSSILNFNLPNFIDEEPLKKIWIQINYIPLEDPQDYPFVVAVEAYDQEAGSVLGQFQGSFALPELGYRAEAWEIYPNPDFELVQIYLQPGILVDQVIIDTVSIPELSTAVLSGMVVAGAAGFSLLRRRRLSV